MSRLPRKYPPLETIQKIKIWCDRQERCHSEVRSKLFSWGLFGNEIEQVISKLIEENHLNEERFAEAFVSGKFRIKKWGRNKIIRELRQRDVSSYNIKAGLKEIDEGDYLQTVDGFIEKKLAQYQDLNDFERNGKTARFLINKGFEPDLVWERINKL